MKVINTDELVVRLTDTNCNIRVRARRKDGKPLTEEDVTTLQILEYILANCPEGL